MTVMLDAVGQVRDDEMRFLETSDQPGSLGRFALGQHELPGRAFAQGEPPAFAQFFEPLLFGLAGNTLLTGVLL